MNAKTVVTVAFVSFVLTLRAQESSPQYDVSVRKNLPYQEDPKWTVSLGRKPSGISLGKSDFVVSGPLVDTFRLAPRRTEDRTLGQKILGLPIVSLFVPGPMPKPTRQGKYFAWGERDAAWTVQADRPIPGPQGVLVTVSR